MIQKLFTRPLAGKTKVGALKVELLGYMNKIHPDGQAGNKFGVQHIRIRSKVSTHSGFCLQRRVLACTHEMVIAILKGFLLVYTIFLRREEYSWACLSPY